MIPERTKRPMPAAVMVLRSAVSVLLLFGSLLPSGPIIQTVAAVVAAPLVLVELVRPFIERLRLSEALAVCVPVFAALLIPAIFLPVVGDYGSDKLFDLGTLSLFTALAATIISSPEHLRIFAKTWMVFGVVVAAVSLTGGTGIADRAIGAGANPIGLARAMAVSIISVVWLMLNQRLRWVLGLPIVAFIGLGMFATGSKGPVLGAGIACVVMMLAVSEKRLIRFFQLVFAGGAAYLAVLAIPALRGSRLGEFVIDPLGVQDTIRTGALDATFQALVSRGIWGHGYGSWPQVTQMTFMDYPHNIWAELAIEAGLFPMLIVASAFVMVLIRLLRTKSISAQLAAGWLTAETVSASLSGDIRARVFWFFLVLGYLVIRWSGERHGTRSMAQALHGTSGKSGSGLSEAVASRSARGMSPRDISRLESA